MNTRPPSELQKMITGKYYDPIDPELAGKRIFARQIINQFRAIPYENWNEKRELYTDFFGKVGMELFIEQPFTCDYGFNIFWGDHVYVNFDCIFLDSAPIHIGDRVMIAPSVKLFTATHPLDHTRRNSGLEFAKPIIIEDDVWLGGGVIVNPGIRIGARAVIGSGSVVTRDVPAGVMAAGNPARVIKSIDNGD